MKQIILFCFVAFQFSCNNETKKNEPTENATVAKASNEVAGTEFLEDNQSKIYASLSDPIPPPTSDLDVKSAMQMIKNYLGSKRYIRHSRDGGQTWRDDTKCVWFKKEIIKKIYDALECEKGDGVRVYFGVYDDPASENLLYKTVIFTTTYDTTINGVKCHYDNLKASCSVKQDLWNDIKMIPQNQGGLCPPPKDSCHTLGALLLPKGQ